MNEVVPHSGFSRFEEKTNVQSLHPSRQNNLPFRSNAFATRSLQIRATNFRRSRIIGLGKDLLHNELRLHS